MRPTRVLLSMEDGGLFRSVRRAGGSVLAPFLWKSFWAKHPTLTTEPTGQAGGFWKGKRAALTISFDLDYPQDVAAVPDLLGVLNARTLQTSFAIVGKFFERDATLLTRIAKAKHELINHSFTHPNGYWNPHRFFTTLTPLEQRAEVQKCHELVWRKARVRMVGFRTPHFGDQHAHSVYPLLQHLGYAYSSSTIGTRVGQLLPFVPDPLLTPSGVATGPLRVTSTSGVLELPVMSCPAHYYPVFDSYHCFRSAGGAHPKPGQFFLQFKRAVSMCVRHGAYANFYFDPMDVTRTPDFAKALDWLDTLRDSDDVWVAPSKDVAAFWNTHAPGNHAGGGFG